jgi:hypothetical protein
MKTAHKPLLLGLALSLALAGGASAQVDFTKYYALGDSLTAGFVSYGLVQTYQVGSTPALIAKQAGVKIFQQPTVSEPGLPPLLYLKALVVTPFGVSPVITNKSGLGAPTNATLVGSYNNLGIVGANTNDVLTRTGNILNFQSDFLKAIAGQVGFAVPFADLVLRDGKTTAIQQAVGSGGTFFTVAIGSNDILGAVQVALPIDGVTMTPLPVFTQQYDTLLATLKSQRPNTKVMVATIQDVLPFVTTVKPYLVVPTTGAKVYLIGQNGLLTANDYLTLQASSLISQGIGVPTALGGTGLPLPEGSIDATGLHAGVIIRAAEATTIFQRILDLNSIIKSEAAKYGFGVVDLWAAYRNWNTYGADIGGVEVTTAFLTGGMFSYDGLHNQQIGYGLIANEWIKAINAQYNMAIPVVNLRPLALSATSVTSVEAANFVLDPEAGIRMIKSIMPNALTDQLVAAHGIHSRGPAAQPAPVAKPGVTPN